MKKLLYLIGLIVLVVIIVSLTKKDTTEVTPTDVEMTEEMGEMGTEENMDATVEGEVMVDESTDASAATEGDMPAAQ